MVKELTTATEINRYYVHIDHLGTPQQLSDENGIVVWKASYQPFGEVLVNADVDGDGNATVMNVRFPGQYYDQESGNHYNYYRDYDPRIGRYVQSDPIGLDGGVNTYAYVGQNPMIYKDEYGLAYYPEWSPFNGDLVLEPGAAIEAWIADLPGNEVANGCSDDPIPENADIDFIRVQGQWYKIKGFGATVTRSGKVKGFATYPADSAPFWFNFRGGAKTEAEKYINKNGPSCECN